MGGTQLPSGLRNTVQGFSHIRALLPKMIDNDVLAFFQGYEHTLLCNDVDRSLWIKLLTAQLSSKAIRAFSRLSSEDKMDYDVVKITRRVTTGWTLRRTSRFFEKSVEAGMRPTK